MLQKKRGKFFIKSTINRECLQRLTSDDVDESASEYVEVYSNSPIIITIVRTKEDQGFRKNSDVGKISVKLRANPMTRKMKEVITFRKFFVTVVNMRL